MDFQGMIADQMGALTPYDIGGALVSVCCAALGTYAVGAIAVRRDAPGLREHAALAALLAAVTVLVRGSLPLAVALLAGLLLVRSARERTDAVAADRLLQVLAVVAGVGCGAGGSLIVLVLLLPLALLLRWALRPRTN